jgi:hypothetical protein
MCLGRSLDSKVLPVGNIYCNVRANDDKKSYRLPDQVLTFGGRKTADV